MTALAMKHEYQGVFMTPRNTGASLSASNVDAIVANASAELRKPITWQLRFAKLREQLEKTFEECSKAGWDGYNAAPLSTLAFSEAIRFAEALPSWMPLPEVVPEPDGSIGFEWYGGKDRVFVVSLSGNNTIVYAGLIGKGNRSHGVKAFNDSIPTIVIQSVNEILS